MQLESCPSITKTARSLDQFYTRADIAERCVARVAEIVGWRGGNWHWIEPSAGAGAFLDHFPMSRFGLDIAPRRADIVAADFLDWTPKLLTGKIVVVGNPPFGKNASLARRFFDHAAGFADMIALILPRTFEKSVFVNRLSRRMHLVSSEVLELYAFELEGEPYAVPTCFQIWERGDAMRPLVELPTMHADFDFVAQHIGDFAFQRVGARAGLASKDGLRKSAQSHYFLKANICSNTLLNRFSCIDWGQVKNRTAGNPSIGKSELIAEYQAAYG